MCLTVSTFTIWYIPLEILSQFLPYAGLMAVTTVAKLSFSLLLERLGGPQFSGEKNTITINKKLFCRVINFHEIFQFFSPAQVKIS